MAATYLLQRVASFHAATQLPFHSRAEIHSRLSLSPPALIAETTVRLSRCHVVTCFVGSAEGCIGFSPEVSRYFYLPYRYAICLDFRDLGSHDSATCREES